MTPSWYSSYLPKTGSGITAMNQGASYLDFVKYFRGTSYYNKRFDVEYTYSGTTVPTGAMLTSYTMMGMALVGISLY